MEIGCKIMSQICSTVSSHLDIISVSISIHHYIYNCLYMWLSGVGKIPWRRAGQPIPVFCPGEFHGLYSPWGCKESDTTERLSLSFHFSYMLVVQSCPIICNSMDFATTSLLCPWNSPGKNAGVGCHFLLQRIFPTPLSHMYKQL